MTSTDQEIHVAVEGQTVPLAFVRTIREHGDLVALREKVGYESRGVVGFGSTVG